MKRILIKAYTNINFGDDLFVKVLCERYPKTKFYINCSIDNDIPFEYIPNLTIMNKHHLKGMLIFHSKKLMNKLKIKTNFPYDGEVYIGGSIFIEPDDYHIGHKYKQELLETKISPKIPYFILGTNFGPYSSQDFVNIHKKFFKNEVVDICMRDMKSKNIFSDIENVRFAPDIIFTYQPKKIDKEDYILISCIYNDQRLGINNFDNQKYKEKLIELCHYYQSINKKVVLLSMCDHQNDHIMCNEILKECHDNVSIFSYDGTNINETIELFEKCEYVIASRFHAMIMAWITNTPVFPISYSNKTINAIQDYDFKGNHSMIEDFINMNVNDIDRNRLNNYIFDISDIRKEAQKQFLKLDKFLEERI